MNAKKSNSKRGSFWISVWLKAFLYKYTIGNYFTICEYAFHRQSITRKIRFTSIIIQDIREHCSEIDQIVLNFISLKLYLLHHTKVNATIILKNKFKCSISQLQKVVRKATKQHSLNITNNIHISYSSIWALITLNYRYYSRSANKCLIIFLSINSV